MKKIFISLIAIFLLSFSNSPSIIGKWKTVDDESGKAVSVIEIHEKGGKYYGKIVELLNPGDRNRKCVNCKGEDKNKPIMGLTVIKGLAKEKDEYTGKILDPKSGNIYKCNVELETADKLKVRGYIGVSLIGRTQYWHRVK
ncbi:DUF2147 domain-containing protein [Flavobacterium silvaticum]|uniref:DUF2147 domain-containing protein n=1 Tax=Flavobacterium silvaticum TaxID=1852020 RepID=A0A972FJ16_9FLAO|nr:DUF2147 domain-containing protein [Flavobacterium silvaticum]NMH26934.1 DUF2147 domain-containing protein [Flavobacterium silvaticum]